MGSSYELGKDIAAWAMKHPKWAVIILIIIVIAILIYNSMS